MPPCASSVSADAVAVQPASRSATVDPPRQFHKRGQDARWPWYRSPKGLTNRARQCRLTLNDATVIESIAVRVFGPCVASAKEGADVTVRGIAESTATRGRKGMQRTAVERALHRLLARHVVYRRPNPYMEDGSFLYGLYEPETWTAENTVEAGAIGWPRRETVQPPAPDGRLLIFPPMPKPQPSQGSNNDPSQEYPRDTSPLQDDDGYDFAADVARLADDGPAVVDNVPDEAFFNPEDCPHSDVDGNGRATSVKKLSPIPLATAMGGPATKPDTQGSAWGPARYFVSRLRQGGGRRVLEHQRLTDAIGALLDEGSDGLAWDLVPSDRPQDVPKRLAVRVRYAILARWEADWQDWIIRECIAEARGQRDERLAFREAEDLERWHAIREAVLGRWPGVRALAERTLRESRDGDGDPAVENHRGRVLGAVAEAAEQVRRTLEHPLDVEVQVEAALAEAALDRALEAQGDLFRSITARRLLVEEERERAARIAEDQVERARAVERVPVLVEQAEKYLAEQQARIAEPPPEVRGPRDVLLRHVWNLRRESAERSAQVLSERIAELRAVAQAPSSLDLGRFNEVEREIERWPMRMAG